MGSIVSFELYQPQSLHTFVCVPAHKQLPTWRGTSFKIFHLSLSVKLILINTTYLKRLMEISSNLHRDLIGLKSELILVVKG